jgi:two-component system CitB family response regulator
MIRTLVVDDDFRVAAIHAAYVAKVDGFEVIAQAHTAAEAVEAVDRLRPDLMLLDLYLPDEHGLKLVGRLRDGHPPVDVIVITAAKDAGSVRAAMQGGALHYLLKPFSFPVLRDKLLSYAQMRTRLGSLREADQRTVDRVFGALRAPDQLSAVKGRSVHTLEAVEQLLAEVAAGSGSSVASVGDCPDLSAAEVAERTGMSRATAQRYLTHLHELGRVDIRLRYGTSGRPEHGYRWRVTGLREPSQQPDCATDSCGCGPNAQPARFPADRLRNRPAGKRMECAIHHAVADRTRNPLVPQRTVYAIRSHGSGPFTQSTRSAAAASLARPRCRSGLAAGSPAPVAHRGSAGA